MRPLTAATGLALTANGVNLSLLQPSVSQTSSAAASAVQLLSEQVRGASAPLSLPTADELASIFSEPLAAAYAAVPPELRTAAAEADVVVVRLLSVAGLPPLPENLSPSTTAASLLAGCLVWHAASRLDLALRRRRAAQFAQRVLR
jgi:hypothetical protein